MPSPRAPRRTPRPPRRALRALALALLLAGVMPATAAAAGERRLVGLINAERLAHGAAPLELATPLQRAAGEFAHWAVGSGNWGHAADGRTATERARLAGWPGGHVAENLAIAATAELVVEAWLASPAHAANLLDPQRSTVGAGEQAGHWVVVFGAPCPAGLDEACGLTGDLGDRHAAAGPVAVPGAGGAPAAAAATAAPAALRPARLRLGRPRISRRTLRVRVGVHPAARGRLVLRLHGPRGWRRTLLVRRGAGGAARLRVRLPRRGRYRVEARFDAAGTWLDADRTRRARAR